MDPEAEPFIVVKDTTGNYFEDVNYRVSAARTLKQEDKYDRPLEKAHSSLTYNNTLLSFRISFFWRPVFNQSAADLLHQLGVSKSVPRLVVAGSGAWDIKLSNGSEEALNVYARNLEQVARVS